MLIQNITLNNLLSYEGKHQIYFREGINIILGKNGSGKTNLIEAIFYALYNDFIKTKTKKEALPSFLERPEKITSYVELETNFFKIKRYLNSTNEGEQDFIKIVDKQIIGKEKSLRLVESKICPKKFFEKIVYVAQGKIFEIIEMIPSERNKLLNEILQIDYLENFGKEMDRLKKYYENRLFELNTIIKKLQSDKIEQIKNINESLKKTRERLKEVTGRLRKLEMVKGMLDKRKLFYEKRKWIEDYWKLRKIKKVLEQKETALNDLKNKLNEVKIKINDLKNQISLLEKEQNKYKKLLKENKCPYCERELSKKDRQNFEELSITISEKLVELLSSKKELENLKVKIESKIKQIENFKRKYNYSRIIAEMTRLKEKVLNTEPIAKLVRFADEEISMSEADLILQIDELKKLEEDLKERERNLEAQRVVLNKREKEIEKLQKRTEVLKKKIQECQDFVDLIKKDKLLTRLRWSALIDLPISKIFSIFNLGKLWYDENFEIFINDNPIYCCSGAEKVATSIAVRLAFNLLYNINLMILDEPTIFLDNQRIEYLKTVLNTIREKGIVSQLIIITHDERLPEIADRIIEIEKDKSGKSFINKIEDLT